MSIAIPTPLPELDLEVLRRTGVLSALDVSYALRVGRIFGEADPLVLLAAALASRAPAHGHVCVDLRAPGDALRNEASEEPLSLSWPAVEGWLKRVVASAMVSEGDGDAPLVCDGSRLYLNRYWCYQTRVINQVVARSHRPQPYDLDALRQTMAFLLSGPWKGTTKDGLKTSAAHDEQLLAALTAVLRGFTIITGGPGTGKTTTVVQLLAMVADQATAMGTPNRVFLLAPTGKAAARLREAISKAKTTLGRQDLSERTSTIQRCLGFQPRQPNCFKHNSDNLLPADTVIVDEASMVDLSLMAKLLTALPEGCRVVLVGDRHQLKSVEAGSVLGDLCDAAIEAQQDERSPAGRVMDTLVGEPVSHGGRGVLAEGVRELTQRHRFAEHSGIALLADAVREGKGERVLSLLLDPQVGDVTWIETQRDGQVDGELKHLAVAGFRSVVQAATSEEALARLGDIAVLTPHRHGLLGVYRLNERIQAWLKEDGCFTGDSEFPPGLPVMVLENDHQLELYNGDVGVVRDVGQGGSHMCFAGQSGEVRTFHPARIPRWEPVFAMTAHKCQGSEYEAVILVLPQKRSPVMTRELLYTAITRARGTFTLLGGRESLLAGLEERVSRHSGMREGLLGTAYKA